MKNENQIYDKLVNDILKSQKELNQLRHELMKKGIINDSTHPDVKFIINKINHNLDLIEWIVGEPEEWMEDLSYIDRI